MKIKPLLEKLKNWLNWIFMPFKFLWGLVIKIKNYIVRIFIKIFLWMNEHRLPCLLGAFILSCLLVFVLLYFFVSVDDKENTYWGKMSDILKDYPTIALTLASLPIALTLWLFRNHDNVKKLDLDMYHEAVKNIHDEKASVGLRQVAFATLIELRKKWMWEKKIRTIVFPGANLSKLELQKINLDEDSLEDYEFTEL